MTVPLALPETADAIVPLSWSELAPHYESLLETPLGQHSVREWLKAWSDLDELVDEAFSIAMVAYTADTRDAERETTYLRWASGIAPKLHELRVKLGERLLPFELALPDLRVMLREIRTDVSIFREENLPRMAELEELEATYDKITGGLTVQFEGEERTIPALQPFLLERDRDLRERAFRAGANAYLEKRSELATLFDRMVRVRDALGRAAGFDNYRDYAFAAKYRFDYTPDDCLRFHAAVEEAVLPAIERMHAVRKERLEVDRLRPWDLQIRPERESRLVPFRTIPAFVETARRMFNRVDAELGSFFKTMADESLLDLESRQGKAPGGYCTRFAHRGRPFIFMNAVGVHDDVSTLVHECGHAFHTFLGAHLPYLWVRQTGHEAAELASMSMELLAAPYLESPVGYYPPVDAADAQLDHLEDVLLGLPHIACVDAFQQWLYTDGIGAAPDERDAKWLSLRARFEPTVDYEGLAPERTARWYRQSHIFTAPFYYIEYGIAQLGALQVWHRSLSDGSGALARYKEALSLGGVSTLPEIYSTAGASLVFDASDMLPLVQAVEQRMNELREVAASAR